MYSPRFTIVVPFFATIWFIRTTSVYSDIYVIVVWLIAMGVLYVHTQKKQLTFFYHHSQSKEPSLFSEGVQRFRGVRKIMDHLMGEGETNKSGNDDKHIL